MSEDLAQAMRDLRADVAFMRGEVELLSWQVAGIRRYAGLVSAGVVGLLLLDLLVRWS